MPSVARSTLAVTPDFDFMQMFECLPAACTLCSLCIFLPTQWPVELYNYPVSHLTVACNLQRDAWVPPWEGAGGALAATLASNSLARERHAVLRGGGRAASHAGSSVS